MEYAGNGQYRVNINGQDVVATADELRDVMVEILNFEGANINDHIETVDVNYMFEDSARYELLRTEIMDDGWKELKWSDELDEALSIATECAMVTARNWYESQYIMQRKC